MKPTSEHPFLEQVVHVVTNHDKDQILAPLLTEIGFSTAVIRIDTDQFGTFSGEVERQGGMRETLRQKIKAGAQAVPQARLLLASEGSFVPHPLLGIGQSNLESLLLWQRDTGLEIYVEELSRSPRHGERVFAPGESLENFLAETGFPQHGLMVHPSGSLKPIFKGIHDRESLRQAIESCRPLDAEQKVKISSDLRAMHNPTRQDVIRAAGRKLVEAILSLCPKCHSPGFWPNRGVPGLPCLDCGEPSGVARAVIWLCPVCDYQEERARPDGLKFIDPSECAHCNP